MKRIWIQRIGAAVLCAVLLVGCMPAARQPTARLLLTP